MRQGEGYAGFRRPRRRRSAWSATNPGNAAARRELREALLAATAAAIGADGPLLDCGCGAGWLLEELAATGVAAERLHGIDADGDRVAAARIRAPGATVALGDATALPYADGTFAAVYLVVSLSSMGSRERVRAALAEARRVLAPGGTLAIYEPRLPNPLNPDTRRLSGADLRAAGVVAREVRSLTLLPPLGRRLGGLTAAAHAPLSRVGALRSHRLVVHREPAPRRVAMLLHKSVEHDSRVRRAARALQRANHEVAVIHLPPPGSAPQRSRWRELDGFGLVTAAPPDWVRARIPFHVYRVVFLASFVRAIVRERPDIVHAHDAAMLLPGYVGARLTGAQLVYDSHELATGVPYRERYWGAFVSALERFVVPRCAAVITVSEGIAARLQQIYGLADRPTVVRNIPDLDIARPPDGPDSAGPLRARLGVGADVALVLHQGALAPRRGCETAVRAIARIPDAHLVFLGDAWPGYAGRIESLAARLGLSDRVHVLPGVPVAALLSWTRAADVGLSLLDAGCENHRLALPNKVFEYVAAGVPVVVSDLPELRALLDRHGIGVCCDAARPEALAAAICAVLGRGPELAGEVDRARRVLSWEREQRELTALYERLGDAESVRAAGSALIFVRNGCTHDARVSREARELRRMGRSPMVVGVITARDPLPSDDIDGIPVRRLDPGRWPRGLARRVSGRLPGGLYRPPRPASTRGVDPAALPSRERSQMRRKGPLARVRRLVVTLDWYRQGFTIVRVERPGLVHCNDFNAMWIGVAAKLRYRTPVVYDAHELWPDRNLRSEPRWWLLACEWLFVRVADRVLTTSPAYADVMARRYRVPRPVVVRNVPSYPAVPARARTPVTVPSAGADAPPAAPARRRAVYFGALTSGRGLEQAVAALGDIPDLDLCLVGPEAWGYARTLELLADRLGVRDRVELLDPVAHGDAPRVLADADVGLALIEPVCLSYRLTLPNKLFEYMSVGLPVLTSDLPAIAGLLAETGAGLAVDPADRGAVVAGLREILDPARNAELRAAARAAAARISWRAERELLTRAYDEAMAAA
jgi:glycosyltransferase involved in cell wall biosynthesis